MKVVTFDSWIPTCPSTLIFYAGLFAAFSVGSVTAFSLPLHPHCIEFLQTQEDAIGKVLSHSRRNEFQGLQMSYFYQGHNFCLWVSSIKDIIFVCVLIFQLCSRCSSWELSSPSTPCWAVLSLPVQTPTTLALSPEPTLLCFRYEAHIQEYTGQE